MQQRIADECRECRRLEKEEHGHLIPLLLSERNNLTSWLICLFCFLSASTSQSLLRSGAVSATQCTNRDGIQWHQHLSRGYKKRDVKYLSRMEVLIPRAGV